MNSIKLLIALVFALVFAGCEITVTEDYSSYETDTYTTDYYYKTYDCNMNYTVGDARDVDTYSCSTWDYITGSFAFDFSSYRVVESYDNGSRTISTTYTVYSVEAFSYGGAIYIAYDVGGGLTYEYNYTDDEVGVYDDGIVDYYI